MKSSFSKKNRIFILLFSCVRSLFFLQFFINYFTSISSFPFISDIQLQIIKHDDVNSLEELFTHDSSFIEMRSGSTNTLLHWAAAYNSKSCLSVLLRFAPHLVNAVTKHNYTPLMHAVMNDSRDAAKMLLQAGADVWMKEGSSTVFDQARVNNYKEMLEILEQHQQVSGIF